MNGIRLTLIFLSLLYTTAGIKLPCSESSFKFVGCYGVDWSRFKMMEDLEPFSMDQCEALCRSEGYNFMGVSRSGRDDRFYHCHCGDNTYKGNAEQKSSTSCWSPCPGDHPPTTNTCGGHFLISVYELEPLPLLESTAGASCEVRNVSFLLGAADGVGHFSTAAGGSFASIMSKVETVIVHVTRKVDYHIKSNSLYFVRDEDLFMDTLDYKTDPEAGFPSFLGVTVGFAVDWVHNTIYMGDRHTGSIIMVDLYGNNYTTVLKKQVADGLITHMEVDPYVGKVFWLHENNLEWSDLTGDNNESNLNELNVTVTAIALDVATSRLFYVGLPNGDHRSPNFYVMRYNSSGSFGTTKYPASMLVEDIRGLGVLGGYIYWLNWMDVVFRQSVDDLSGRPEMVIKVAKDLGYVYTIRLMDTELQKEPVDDPCRRLTCSHFCVHQAGVARCVCPNGKELVDNTTCN